MCIWNGQVMACGHAPKPSPGIPHVRIKKLCIGAEISGKICSTFTGVLPPSVWKCADCALVKEYCSDKSSFVNNNYDLIAGNRNLDPPMRNPNESPDKQVEVADNQIHVLAKHEQGEERPETRVDRYAEHVKRLKGTRTRLLTYVANHKVTLWVWIKMAERRN